MRCDETPVKSQGGCATDLSSGCSSGCSCLGAVQVWMCSVFLGRFCSFSSLVFSFLPCLSSVSLASRCLSLYLPLSSILDICHLQTATSGGSGCQRIALFAVAPGHLRMPKCLDVSTAVTGLLPFCLGPFAASWAFWAGLCVLRPVWCLYVGSILCCPARYVIGRMM